MRKCARMHKARHCKHLTRCPVPDVKCNKSYCQSDQWTMTLVSKVPTVIGASGSLCSQSALTLYYTACATAVGGKMTCFKTSPAESVKDGVDMVLVTCQSREDCSQRDLSLRVGSNVIRLQRQMCVTSALRSTPG